MTVELSTAELAIGCAFLGGQIAILASVVQSNRSQGRRLGSLERWRTAVKAVRADRRQRRQDTMGIPLTAGASDTDESGEAGE